ncbi:MAG: hypothetical protein O3A87_00805 [Verrucomicrobia bacterium]|nr:hypothetical protein [Verrucomicrobiota bacterium]MDA1005009.1 hypothetical protein [Verrucomicrobiota bacterium]
MRILAPVVISFQAVMSAIGGPQITVELSGAPLSSGASVNFGSMLAGTSDVIRVEGGMPGTAVRKPGARPIVFSFYGPIFEKQTMQQEYMVYPAIALASGAGRVSGEARRRGKLGRESTGLESVLGGNHAGTAEAINEEHR